MADEPKPNPTDQPAPNPAADASSVSPALTDAVEMKPEGASAAKPPDDPKPQVMPADPLSDGTVPTVLATGTSHKSVTKGKASISSIYRRADILTTILTFVGALIAAGVLFGAYAFLTRSKTSVVPAPKVTSLDKADLAKLSTFFDGNSAGSSSQVLTISSSSLFNNRVAISSDLKVVGGVQVAGTTALGDLTVDKVSTLGVTNIRGQLLVAGPVNFQSPAQFGAGGSVNGNLAVTGNGSFGGSISAGTLNAATISVSTINLSGHLSITGSAPSVSGTGLGSSATIEGNDSSGTVSVTVGTCVTPQCAASGSQLVIVTFHNPYPRTPHIIISPIGPSSARLEAYVQPGSSSFTIGAATINNPNANSFSFTYWVVQ